MKTVWRPLRSFVRQYATRRPERPPSKFGDPLLDDKRSQIQQISKDMTFIYRQPPTAPTPFSTTLTPSSPLLKPPTIPVENLKGSTSRSLLPLPVRQPREVPTTRDHLLTQDDFAKMKELRASDPALYTRSKVAKMFNCSPWLVGQQAPLPSPALHQAHEKREKEHEERRSRWGENKATVMAIRKKRRTFW